MRLQQLEEIAYVIVTVNRLESFSSNHSTEFDVSNFLFLFSLLGPGIQTAT